MRRGVGVWLGCAALLCGVAVAGADAGHELTEDELMTELARHRVMAAYVKRNGQPDVAEKHFLADRGPWEKDEVTLYYLDRRKEIGFARAAILGRPEIHLVRYERDLTDAEVAELARRARPEAAAPAPANDPVAPAEAVGAAPGDDPVARAEAAADRSEDAAQRVEKAADATERAADRAEAVVAQVEDEFQQALLK